MTRQRISARLTALAAVLGVTAFAGLSAHAADKAPLRLTPEIGTPAAARSASKTAVVPAALAVGVRAGEHAVFSRLVIDWTVPVGYTVDNKDGFVRIAFDRPGDIKTGRVASHPPRGVFAVGVSNDAGGNPALTFSADGRVRHFRDGTKIVVDVMFAKDGKPAKATAETGGPTQLSAAETPKPRVVAGVMVGPQGAHGAETTKSHGHLAVAGPAAQPAPLPTTPAVRNSHAAVDHSPVPPFTGAGAQPTANSKDHVADATHATGAPVDFEVDMEKDGVRIIFGFDEPTAAAAFRRGGRLWLVFDKATRVDTDLLAEQAGRFAPRIEQIGHRDATVLRIETKPGYNPSIASDGNSWTVDLAPQILKPDTSLVVSFPPSRDAALSITTATAGAILTLHDPEVGDVFYVVPVIESAHGIKEAHEFIDFRLLPSAQGVVVSPYSDRVDVRGRADGVSVAAIGGLRVTLPADRARLLEVAAIQGPPDAFFDFRGWQRSDEGSFEAVRKVLTERLIGASYNDRNLARIDLARFYFSYGLADRTRGVLSQISRETPEMERSPAFRALRGAAALLMGDLKTAREDLDDHGLDQEREIEVWRAAVLAGEGDMTGAAYGFQQTDRFVAAYPATLRARFGLTGAQAALAIDDIHVAEFWVDFLKTTSLTGSQTERYKLIQAEIAAANGEAQTAISLYDDISDGRDRYSRTRAGLDRVELMLEDGRMTPAEAAEQLDRLRYVWRGDDLEFEVLRRLGELQIASGKYRDGLNTLKRAVTNFADSAIAPKVTEGMRTAFRQLYIDGKADDLPAVTAIALFNEFRELAPAGAEGDEMIRRLAERMITVDLLDKAADLLAHQVEFRLQGEVKAEVGTRLAIIRLLDRKPDEALAALEASRVSGMSAELTRERLMVGARAYAETGNKVRALTMIASDRSEDADRLRAEILWRARDWAGAASVLDRLAGKPPAGDELLSEQRARYVLNGAVALALAGDLDKLARVRRSFGAVMEKTALAADFRIIVAADRTARDFDDVLKRIATVDDFDAFMKSYRKRLMQPQTAAAGTAAGTAARTDLPG